MTSLFLNTCNLVNKNLSKYKMYEELNKGVFVFVFPVPTCGRHHSQNPSVLLRSRLM